MQNVWYRNHTYLILLGCCVKKHLFSGRLSLKTQTTIAVTMLFILLATACGYLGERYLEDTIREAVQTVQFSYVTSLAHSIDDKLDLVHTALISTAGQLDQQIVTNPDKSQEFLDSHHALKSFYDNALFIFSADGTIIAESPFIAGRRGRDISFRSYFQTTMATGKPHISEPYLSTHKPGHPAVILTAPVRDRQGRIIAILAGSFDLLGNNNILADLATMRSGKSGYVYLFTADRTMIMHPDRSRILKRDVPPGANIMYDKAIAGFEGSGETVNSRGLHALASFKRLQKTGWILGANAPVSETFAPLEKARRYAVSISALFVVLIAGLVWFLMSRQLAPLDIISDHLKNSDAGSRLPESLISDNEIGTLVTSFNGMVDLQEKERTFLQTMIDAIPDLIFFKDTNSVYLGCNNAFARTFIGRPQEQILGKTDLDLVPDRDLAAFFRRKDREAMDAGEPRSNEENIVLADGTEISVEVVKVPFRNEYGSVVGLIGISRDITERKNTQRELLVAKEAAEAANRAKSEFLANMSHEIRTPLNGVLGMGQLLEMTDLNEEQREYARTISLSGANLLALINNILDLSKIEADRLEFEQRSFSIRSCIKDVVAMQNMQYVSRGLYFNVSIPHEVPDILVGDELRLKQILANLVANAAKFTEKGGVTLGVQVMEQTEPTILLDISVSDTGIGIASEQLQRIFAPFEQGDGSTTRKFGGTGLGLTICQRLTHLMGGSIQVESTPGCGSSFRTRIPFQVAIPERSTDLPCEAMPQWDGSPLKILIAEDNTVNQVFLSTVLGKMGHRSTCADNGARAIELWRERQFDCILMDVQMPVMGGVAAVAGIRREEAEDRHIPIIALTAHALVGDRDRFLQSGFDGYLSKPVIIADLVEQLKQINELPKLQETRENP
jgi:PAS domain S-box-containing protein